MKKLFSTVLFSFLMLSPVAFVSCGDDEEDEVVNNNTQNGEQGSENNGENQGSEGNGENQNQNSPLIGVWMRRDSTEALSGSYRYIECYLMFDKDYYYDISVIDMEPEPFVVILRYSYSSDDNKLYLTAYPDNSYDWQRIADDMLSISFYPPKSYTRVDALPQMLSEKIAAGDFVDMDLIDVSDTE